MHFRVIFIFRRVIQNSDVTIDYHNILWILFKTASQFYSTLRLPRVKIRCNWFSLKISFVENKSASHICIKIAATGNHEFKTHTSQDNYIFNKIFTYIQLQTVLYSLSKVIQVIQAILCMCVFDFCKYQAQENECRKDMSWYLYTVSKNHNGLEFNYWKRSLR